MTASDASTMMQDTCTQEDWVARAALCELLAMSLQLPTRELAAVLVSGEFAEALDEVGEKVGLDSAVLTQAGALLVGYAGQDPDELFHVLRAEYTRLFVGAPEPVVSPYAGVWYARKQGVEPLLFVSVRAMEIERFLRRCGVGQAKGKNEPLDNIATEFEFLQYLALVNAGVVEAPKEAEDVEDGEGTESTTTGEGGEGAKDPAITQDTFNTFSSHYVADWSEEFADAVATATKSTFYQAIAKVLNAVGGTL
ncbi:MAG: molecular chaperone TorD family protein [Coriobacteriales bacterium]|jgi:TorA maturation chaperone TorD|nr:molecular chaperone TorD family protein [Coriobacteriales bacterium]